MIKSYSYGACEEVTGSKHYVDVDGYLIQIDCGLFQGGDKDSLYNKNKAIDVDPKDIDSVIITHGHADHCAMLPYIIRHGYKGAIYATSATRDLANIIMLDSAKIQANEYEAWKKEKDSKSGGKSRKKKEKKADKAKELKGYKPFYNEDDCIQAVSQTHTVPYRQKSILTDNINFELFDAGHILGSSMVELFIRDKKNFLQKLFSREKETRILFTGDIGREEKPIIRKPDTDFPAPDYIYLESTYGDRLHSKVEIALDDLARIINDTYKRGGKVIIPSFAVERTQEIIYYLHILTEQKKIPKLPIYVDSPMATSVTSVFQIHPECYADSMKKEFLDKKKNPFHFGKLTFVDTMQQSKKLDGSKEPMIIISANGMCEAGRVTFHLASSISDEKNTILVVGYMAENTLGRRILEGDKNVNILGTDYAVKAQVCKIDAFSAHADYQEMIDWLGHIDTSRLKKIFLVHGNVEAQEGFKKHLADAGYKNVEIVRAGEEYRL